MNYSLRQDLIDTIDHQDKFESAVLNLIKNIAEDQHNTVFDELTPQDLDGTINYLDHHLNSKVVLDMLSITSGKELQHAILEYS